MPQMLKIATAQSRTLDTTADTLRALERTTKEAKRKDVDVILFPEAYLGGYPRSCTFGSAVGGRSDAGRDQFLNYFHAAVDLGDTPQGAGDEWLARTLPLPREGKIRGDGTREELERIARETGVFIVTGLVEKSGGTLYCGVVYVDPRLGVLGKRRKVMPTGSERVVWGQGKADTLKAVVAHIKGVRVVMASAICWENYMPLLRYSLYSQNVNLWLAPTADARPTWEALMRTVGMEGRCFVVSANQCVKRKHLPTWISGTTESKDENDPASAQTNGVGHVEPHAPGLRTRRRSTITLTEHNNEICWPIAEDKATESGDPNGTSAIEDEPAPKQPPVPSIPKAKTHPQATTLSAQTSSDGEEFLCRGGSCIISPMGETLAGPCWEKEDELLIVDVDFEDCERGRLDLDVAGSYSRMDSFHLTVDGLDLNPPP
ncbi:carbon-nitrogen hydrolase [Lophiotrema nucula]|uniref:Carbon-nitrogen hydrolase n=1 Tax=Lophiotrema nucula TaxID=690887 RepID=A0A6A5ZMW1_9PLEO|nr:carbon-nitrogen hydrolase [Lophiotrema nucula]